MKRSTFIRNAGIAGGTIFISPHFAHLKSSWQDDFPLTDLHVHTTQSHTMEKIMEISASKKIRFGIVENPGALVRDDASLQAYIDRLRQYPVYIGLQPMSPGWSRSFSPEVIARLDYVLMDAQTIPSGNGYGDTLRIWNFDTYIDNPDKFMEVYVAHKLEVINNNERLDIFGWPLFLPVCIARDYYSLWTEERMQKIISAARKRNIAIEINDLARVPHEKFINMAKEQGLKFTFGSDTRDIKTGRLDYCKNIAKKCNLRREDFFVPKRVLNT